MDYTYLNVLQSKAYIIFIRLELKRKKQAYMKITFRQVSRYTDKFRGQISTIVPFPLGISIGPGSDSGMQMAYRYLSVLAQGLTELVH